MPLRSTHKGLQQRHKPLRAMLCLLAHDSPDQHGKNDRVGAGVHGAAQRLWGTPALELNAQWKESRLVHHVQVLHQLLQGIASQSGGDCPARRSPPFS